MTFSAALRAGTMADHQVANGAEFVRVLFDQRLSLAGFAALVAQHYFIYQVLEEAADAMAGDPVAGPFASPELRRLPALEQDLAHLYGPEWASIVEPGPATVAYTDRLREVAFDWPGGFVAHHYTRYLGDISGGQAVGAVTERQHGIVDHAGTRFYVFDQIPDRKAFKARYHELLNTAPWDEAERERVIEESRIAYRHNSAVFTDLERHLPQYLLAS
ncbi:biliverdin-producing heme oxygenase [Kutzneria sp. CA-103260]|uniref:biliverdin-producing heme oxygenase n=1 Tax=Kutzneria sp. CA-103260 TaxID=2802641 RepID=UPI001BEF6550|nr:biliverdin-producing heme oxygenase [Kutzneria sp. CA-103260]QUQ71067.1 biliverdin-producing heme oxygenase [Kutzneria sp. CA-103260]